MSSRSRRPVQPVAIALCLMLACAAVAVIAAASAHAADFRMVLCAANNGSNGYTTTTNTTSPQNPGGIFNFENHCGPGPFPAGDAAFLRIVENQSGGNAGQGAYGDIYYDTPPFVHFREAGGYTREPNAFNEGWRARFWIAGGSVGGYELLSQGQGAPVGTTSTFASHLWPIGGYLDFTRFVFELECVRPAGCDRANYNAADANSFVFTLADESPSQVGLNNNGGPIMEGRWVRGAQTATYQFTELGSGIRMERLRIDGGERFTIDHWNECDRDSNGAIGEFARQFQPCAIAPNPIGRAYGFDTASLADGAHTLQACTQDYAQWQGVNGSGSESCDQRTIHVDNTPPGKPAALAIRSANPNRYLDHFGATFSLPPNQGSPIAKVHYQVLNAANEVVVSEKTVSGTNPSEVSNVEGPAHAGAYHLKAWLEDEVGFQGPAAEVAIPHDTTPPAAPQDLRVTGPTSARWVGKLDLGWSNVVDAGSPIDAAHYEFLDASGNVLGSMHTVAGEKIEAIHGIETPAQRGADTLRVWLSDEEGNVGAAANVAVPRDTTPPAAPQGLSVTPPATSRGADGFDVRWHDIQDNGSPIVAAHYQVLDASGKVAVPAQTARGQGIEALNALEAPSRSGEDTLKLWLEDEEGNVGAPVTAPLAYQCVRSDASGGQTLTAGLGSSGAGEEVVRQGEGSALRGRVSGPGGGVANAVLCVFSRVVTDSGREFLGFAVSGPGGDYQVAIGAGPSRELEARYRSGHREVSANAVLETIVRPIFKVRRKVVRNERYAQFTGHIPAPDNDSVIVVLQVRRGKGWLAFRRYRTRDGGKVTVGYRFTRTEVPTRYVMRAQVRSQAGYPYVQGNSRRLTLIVLPRRGRR